MIQVISQCLPTYKVCQTLGEGIYGTVFSIDDGLKERAVKVVPLMVERSLSYGSPADLDTKISQDFHAVREYYEKIAGPGVLKVHDFHLVGKNVTDTSARAYLVILMELCSSNLRDVVLDAKGGLPPAQAMKITAELARVLKRLTSECSETFLVTDLKPANLLFDSSGSLVIGDLGGLKRLSSVSSTATAQFTPNWSAPETILKAEQAKVPAIIYSFGLVAYFIWEGMLPFEDEDFIARIRLVKERGITFSREDVPASIQALIRRCLAFEPAKRPADFAAVCLEAEKALADFSAPPPVKAPAKKPVKVPGNSTPARQVQDSQNPANRSTAASVRKILCPACSLPHIAPQGASLSSLKCRRCGQALSQRLLNKVEQYLFTMILILAGWGLASGLQIGLAAWLVPNQALTLPAWTLAGAISGLALRYAIVGFGPKHILLAIIGWTLGGAIVRASGGMADVSLLAGWLLGASSIHLALRYSLPGFDWNQVLTGIFLWALGLLLGSLAVNYLWPQFADTAGKENAVVRLVIIQMTAVLFAGHSTYWQIVRTRQLHIKKGAASQSVPAPATREISTGQ
jgi:serine/threonine protein kinase